MFKKGNKIGVGRVCSKETREKIRSALELSIPKGRQTNTGRTHFKKGQIPWNKGLTKDTSEMLRQNGRKIAEANKGRRYSPATEIKKGQRLSPDTEFGGPRGTGLQGRMKLLEMRRLGEPTSIEKTVYKELKAKGILFEREKFINGKFAVDVYIPSLNLIIECDGDYWHSSKKQKAKDTSKSAYLRRCGFRLLRLAEREIKDRSFLPRLEVYLNG